MIRLRSFLLFLVVTVLLLSGMPVSAGSGSDLPSWLPAPTPNLSLDAGQCPAPADLEPTVRPSDFILCTCDLCKNYPDVVCQISPMGYSILCEDYARTHC